MAGSGDIQVPSIFKEAFHIVPGDLLEAVEAAGIEVEGEISDSLSRAMAEASKRVKTVRICAALALQDLPELGIRKMDGGYNHLTRRRNVRNQAWPLGYAGRIGGGDIHTARRRIATFHYGEDLECVGFDLRDKIQAGEGQYVAMQRFTKEPAGISTSLAWSDEEMGTHIFSVRVGLDGKIVSAKVEDGSPFAFL